VHRLQAGEFQVVRAAEGVIDRLIVTCMDGQGQCRTGAHGEFHCFLVGVSDVIAQEDHAPIVPDLEVRFRDRFTYPEASASVAINNDLHVCHFPLVYLVNYGVFTGNETYSASRAGPAQGSARGPAE
jgi:hypothetical protein